MRYALHVQWGPNQNDVFGSVVKKILALQTLEGFPGHGKVVSYHGVPTPKLPRERTFDVVKQVPCHPQKKVEFFFHISGTKK